MEPPISPTPTTAPTGPSTTAGGGDAKPVSLGTTPSQGSGAAGVVLPLLLLVAVFGGLLVPASNVVGRLRGRR